MIRIQSIEHFLWHNRIAEHPLLLVKIQPGNSSAWKFTSLNAGVRDALTRKFPVLASGEARIDTATELLATLCVSMQQEKFNVPFFTAANGAEFGFAALDPYYASTVANQLVSFLNHLIASPELTPAQIAATLGRLDDLCEPEALDQSVRAMVAEADRRGIPWFRMAPHLRDVQFGLGHKQQRMRETLSTNESTLATSYARDKALSCNLIGNAGLPVGRFATASNVEQAVAVAKSIGFPVVLKPLSMGKGVEVHIGLKNEAAVRDVAAKMLRKMPNFLVQSFLPGADHRLLVVAGRFVAAARRDPAYVVGDGKQTVEELIQAANRDPRRGKHFYKMMNHITIDDELKQMIARQGLALASLAPKGAKILLRRTANISTGGTAVDVTEVIHPDNIRLAERAAGAVSLKVAGVDFITPDITRSWREVGGGICEINASVGLRPHWLSNPARDVVGPIFDTVFAPGEDGRIPTAIVTGTNGKTTTTRMLGHILRAAGHTVGSTTTDGVTINGEMIAEADLAGPAGAGLVLRDSSVTAAALETARGGLLKRGIYLKQCDVAALLNVRHEQVGVDGIDTLEQMAELKGKVLKTARHKIILNAEDAYCMNIAREYPADFTILFALDGNVKEAKAHCAAGGTLVTLETISGKETIVIRTEGATTNVVATHLMPASFKGAARHNIANALAAAALAVGMKVPVKTIAKGLRAFTPSLQDSSGRFNLIEELPTRALFDFAHNPPALTSIIQAVAGFSVEGRTICTLTAPGNRPDHQIDDCARTVAGHFDHYICFEQDEWRRGRKEGEIVERLTKMLLEAGVPKENITTTTTQQGAMIAAAGMAAPSDFILVLGTYIKTSLPQLRSAFGEKKAA